ncbi:hypothetical protein LTR53_009564, partial [Teratosphaeriaceae sp. CCFEE 6253]
MQSSPFFSGTTVLCALSFLATAIAQSIPGATLFTGNGAPYSGAYQLVDDYEPSVFFNKFNFYSSYDPTYGHVQYVNQTVAQQNGFVTTPGNTAVISVDTTNQWPNGGPGRPSVRLISDNTYTNGLFILDLLHMPWGCGTWPAYWLLGPDWPSNGEIDIIEGVNTDLSDSVSLHTSPGCTINGAGQTGTFQTSNCDKDANGNSGCGTLLNNSKIPNNYGDGLNKNGGGVYATEWTANYIKTWFFPRGGIPASITNGAPDTSKFGTPAVNMQSGGGYSCNIKSHFANMSIIINTDFCGAWAGEVYSGSYPQCPQTPGASSLDSCVNFVGNNPSNFTQAYWQINSIKVYQMPPNGQASSSYTTSLPAATPSGTSSGVNAGMGASTNSIGSSAYTGPVSSGTTSSTAASGTPAICPGANGTTWIDANNQGYTIACGSDYNGGSYGLGDSGTQSATSFENCLEICDSVSGCVAVAFTGGNIAGTCYLKNSVGGFVYNGATNAGLRIAGPASGSSSSSSTASTSSLSNGGGTFQSSSTRPSTAPSTITSRTPTSSITSGTSMSSSSSVTSTTSTGSASSRSSSTSSSVDGGTFQSASSTSRPSTAPPSSTATTTSSSSSTSSQTQTSSSSTSSQGSPSASAVCQNQTASIDANGVTYAIYCGSDSTEGSFVDRVFSGGNYTQCESFCDSQTGCAAFTWAPGTGGGGVCYLKHGPSSPTAPVGSNPALYVAGFVAQPSSSSSPVTSGSSSSVAGPGSASSSTTGMASSVSNSASPSSTVVCPPALNNTQLTDSNGKNYTIRCSSDTTGGSFASQVYGSGDFTQCMAGCDNQTGCTGWTWNKYHPGNGGVCYFKGSADVSFASGTVDNVAGILSKPPSAIQCPGSNGTTYNDTTGVQYTILCDMDSVPGASGSDNQLDFPTCINACAAQTAFYCIGVTYVGGTCYYKDQYTAGVVAAGHESAFLTTVLRPANVQSSSSSSAS